MMKEEEEVFDLILTFLLIFFGAVVVRRKHLMRFETFNKHFCVKLNANRRNR